MIVIEIYNNRGIYLDTINNSTEGGSVLGVDFEWNKLGGLISGKLTVSPNYVYALTMEAIIVINWSDEANFTDIPAEFMKYYISGYISQVPEFKVNDVVAVSFNGFWKKLENTCKVGTYTVTLDTDPITYEERPGYSNQTIRYILQDLFERNLKETTLVSSEGVIQKDKPTTDVTNFKITIDTANDILDDVILSFNQQVTSGPLGVILTKGTTYYLSYTVSNNTLTYVSEADYPITNSILQDTSSIDNAPETLVYNISIDDSDLSEVLTSLVQMANLDYRAEQYTCYVDKNRKLCFERLELKGSFHEGVDFYLPNISEDKIEVNRITLYTKNIDSTEKAIYRGVVESLDSISKYGVVSKSLVFTLEEGLGTELDLEDTNAISYIARMLLNKGAYLQRVIEIEKAKSFLEMGLYSITIQQVLGQRTLLEGDQLVYPTANINIPGQWNMFRMTNTPYSVTSSKYLYGNRSIMFELTNNSLVKEDRGKFDSAIYNFSEVVYSLSYFSVWVYLEGNALVDVILFSDINEEKVRVSEQNKWVKVVINPINRIRESIVYMGINEDEAIEELAYVSKDSIIEEEMFLSLDGVSEENLYLSKRISGLEVLHIKQDSSDATPFTLFDDSLEGSFIFSSKGFRVEMKANQGKVYLDQVEVVATSNFTSQESLEQQAVKLGALFENNLVLGARPASLIDEISKNVEEGTTAYEMYKNVSKSF